MTAVNVTIQFAGDAGDGVRFCGARLAAAAAHAGLPVLMQTDPPAEIRSPPGAASGLRATAVRLGLARLPATPADLLFALTPPALAIFPATSARRVILNSELDADPTSDSVTPLSLTRLTAEAVGQALATRDLERSVRFLVLGLALGCCGLPIESELEWIRTRLQANPPAVEAAIRALKAGATRASSWMILPPLRFAPRDPVGPLLSSLEALTLGLTTGVHQIGPPRLVVAGSTAPPGNAILDVFARPEFSAAGVTSLVAEDPAAVALGAAQAGALGVALTSGPGLAEAEGPLNQAAAASLPVVLVHTPRSTHGPGWPELFDLSDLPRTALTSATAIFAPATPRALFEAALHAVHLAHTRPGPVVIYLEPLLTECEETIPLPELSGSKMIRDTNRQLYQLSDANSFLESDSVVVTTGTAAGGADDVAEEQPLRRLHLDPIFPLPEAAQRTLLNAAEVIVIEPVTGGLTTLLRLAGIPLHKVRSVPPGPGLAARLVPLEEPA